MTEYELYSYKSRYAYHICSHKPKCVQLYVIKMNSGKYSREFSINLENLKYYKIIKKN